MSVMFENCQYVRRCVKPVVWLSLQNRSLCCDRCTVTRFNRWPISEESRNRMIWMTHSNYHISKRLPTLLPNTTPHYTFLRSTSLDSTANMDFGSSSSSSRSDGPNEQQVMSQVQGEIQLAMLQEFYTVRPANATFIALKSFRRRTASFT